MNPDTINSAHNETEYRGIMSFPEITAFYNILLERIYLTLERYFLDEPFFLFINALPRNHPSGKLLKYPRKGYYPLVYVGVEKMLEIILKERGVIEIEDFAINSDEKKDYSWIDLLHKSNFNQEIIDAWINLFNTKDRAMPENPFSTTVSEDEGVINRAYYHKLRERTLSLDEIEENGNGKIYDYFGGDESNWRKHQKDEYLILKSYIGEDIFNCNYISLPLIQFAEFDGIVHIIYRQTEKAFFSQKEVKNTLSDMVFRRENVGNIIKSISFVYEEIILNWDFENAEYYKKDSLLELFDLAYKIQDKNALLKELKYAEYYRKYQKYFRNRITYTSKVPTDAQTLYRRIAIMNILIDSYTHNISAHSLVALESWFKQRAYYLDNDGDTAEVNIPDIDFIKNREQHFSHEVHEFVRFMLDKGAFWTGLNRDANYGGKVASLYEVLYEDFICNPLYLGTIAYSEGVTKLNVKIIFQKKLDTAGHDILWEKEILESGILATIDLRHWEENQTSKKRGEDHHYRSGFVHHTSQFEALKKQLEQVNVYFPGGVVGKHALLTIIENEIRNIKHYEPDVIYKMRETGLTLGLSIEPGYYNIVDGKSGNHKPEFYIFGVWLDHPQKISQKDFVDRTQRMWRDIVDDKFNPRLGGLTQDKICASFLFNNEFSKVQPSISPSEKERRFYPWMKLGFEVTQNESTGLKTYTEWEVSARRSLSKEQAKEAWPEGRVDLSVNVEDARRFFQEHFAGGAGNYKKYLYLWQGEDIFTYQYNEDTDQDWENRARFRFVYLPEHLESGKRQQAFNRLRKEGSIRILDRPAESIGAAYNEWFSKWIKEKQPGEKVTDWGTYLRVKAESIALAYWDGTKTTFSAAEKVSDKLWERPTNYNTLKLTHGRGSYARAESDECRYRNHGAFMEYFCKGAIKPESAEMSETLAAEFIETMVTKVCMFDKRLVKWFEKWSPQKMKMLGCEVYDEQLKIWEKVKERGFFNFHFVVVHLSFIEKLIDPQTKEKYREETIDKFIENEILQGKPAPDNFFLVIASGRGRKQWQYTLNENKKVKEKGYFAFTVYRPLESLHSAAENSQMKLDDIETKYLLTKILMGS